MTECVKFSNSGADYGLSRLNGLVGRRWLLSGRSVEREYWEQVYFRSMTCPFRHAGAARGAATGYRPARLAVPWL